MFQAISNMYLFSLCVFLFVNDHDFVFRLFFLIEMDSESALSNV